MSATHDFLEGLLLAASRLSIWGTLMSASADKPTVDHAYGANSFASVVSSFMNFG